MKFSVFLVFLLPLMSSADIVTSFDSKSNCRVYRSTRPENPRLESEKVIDENEAYGFTIRNLEIDFEAGVASVEVVKRIAMGFDRHLVDGKVYISSKNPSFKSIVNQLNRVLHPFESVCITRDRELVWATPKKFN